MTKHQQKELAKAIEKKIAKYQQWLDEDFVENGMGNSGFRLYCLNEMERLQNKRSRQRCE